MGRRARAEGNGVNMDSLMDALTNVVGILVIVFILVQLNISQAVQKILSELPPVTPEQLAALEDEVEENKLELPDSEELEDKKREEKERFARMREVEEELSRLRTTFQQEDLNIGAVDELKERIEKREAEVELAKKELDQLMAEIERLLALLDDTPKYEPPPPQYVRMPNARPIPEGAEMFRFLVANDRVMYVNDQLVLSRIGEEVRRRGRELLFEGDPVDPRQRPRQEARELFDQKKMVEFLNGRQLGDRQTDVTVLENPQWTRLRVEIRIAEGGGEGREEIANAASTFQRAMRRIAGEGKGVAWFLVHGGSIQTYLEAREIADQMRAPSGWELSNNDFFAASLNDFEVARLSMPAAGDPNAIRIPPPGQKLD